MFRKALILSASAGAGHVRAGQALEKAFVELGAAGEARHIDTLDFTNAMFRRVYSKTYLDLVNSAPNLLGWIYDTFDKPWEKQRLNHAFSKLNTRPFVKMIRDYEPDVVVCTHFLPSDILGALKARARFNVPLTVVITDLDVHGFWLTRRCDHYFVAIEEAKVLLQRLGLAPEAVTVTGIPIDPVFSRPADQTEARRRLGLEANVTTLLLSAGGFGVGPVEKLLTQLCELKHRAQVVAICGRNEELLARVNAWNQSRETGKNVTIHPIGYTTEMDQYMAAGDVLVGKPGGLTTSEALARGLILVIVNPIPGQEERNSDHLLEEGVAIRCNNPPTLAYKIDGLLDDPARVMAMRRRVAALAKADSAAAVVRRLGELYGGGARNAGNVVANEVRKAVAATLPR